MLVKPGENVMGMRCEGCSNADCWTCDCECHDSPMWNEDFPYWLQRTSDGHWIVRWRDSPHPAALFNSNDFGNAKDRAEAARTELIAMCRRS